MLFAPVVPFPPPDSGTLLLSSGFYSCHYHLGDLSRKGLACNTLLLTAIHRNFLILLKDELTCLSATSAYLAMGLVNTRLINTLPSHEEAQSQHT